MKSDIVCVIITISMTDRLIKDGLEKKGMNNMKARLPKGMGGGPQNMQAMIRQAQKMQEDMEKLQAELDAKEHEVSAGGGAVKVKIRGNREIVALELSEDVVDPEDIETLQDLIIAAVNEAVKTVDKLNSEEMNKVTAGLNVPGLM